MKGQPVSSRFQVRAESRNGRYVIVTQAPGYILRYRIYRTTEDGREISSTVAYTQQQVDQQVDEYLGE